MSDFDSFDKVVLSIVATTEHRVDGQRIVGLCSTLVVFKALFVSDGLCLPRYSCEGRRWNAREHAGLPLLLKNAIRDWGSHG